jgi:hypothetical protein
LIPTRVVAIEQSLNKRSAADGGYAGIGHTGPPSANESSEIIMARAPDFRRKAADVGSADVGHHGATVSGQIVRNHHGAQGAPDFGR